MVALSLTSNGESRLRIIGLGRKHPRVRPLWDLNGLLQFATSAICVATLVVYVRVDVSPFIDKTTLFLTALLAAQILVILQLERRRRDPFALILALVLVFFYLARIPTLLAVPASAGLILNRISPAVPADINRSLLFVWFGVWAIFVGLQAFPTRPILVPGRTRYLFSINPVRLIILFTILMASPIYFYYGVGISRGGFADYSRLQSYLNMLLDPDVMLIAATAFLLCGPPTLARRFRAMVIALLVAYFLTRFLIGSRSGIVSIMFAFLFASLAAFNRVVVRRRYVVLGLMVGFPLAVITYGLASTLRGAYNGNVPVLPFVRAELQTYMSFLDEKVAARLTEITTRVGFFDMATNLIAHVDQYRSVLNPIYYAKSVIDNGLTPGFDVFGVVKASQGLQLVYGNATPDELHQYYHSDQMTIFGEYYVLFGAAGALVMLALAAAAFKFIYSSIHFREADTTCFARALILYIYVNFWLNSFGMDWLLIGAPRLIASSLLFMFLLRVGWKKRETVPEGLTRPGVTWRPVMRSPSRRFVWQR